MISKKRSKGSDARLLLDNLRSVHNVGSIFRTAETLGISMVYCAGSTPTPVDRFGRARSDFVKVSLGAEKMLPWRKTARTRELAARLKKEGFQIIALEQAERSTDYRKVRVKGKALFIIGGEVSGVSPDLLRVADVIAEIPLSGKKESLNVSVATGVALFRMLT